MLYAVKTSINPGMAMSWTRVLKSGVIPRHAAAQLVGVRSFAVSAKGKKGGKGGAADAKPVLSKEMKSTIVFGANILKECPDYLDILVLFDYNVVNIYKSFACVFLEIPQRLQLRKEHGCCKTKSNMG
jgi:hypothetical protein